MERLIDSYKTLLDNTDTSFVRYLHDQINWQSRLISILGSRGVGKTTLLLQHIKLHDNPPESLYVLADDFYFAEHRLFDLALKFYQQGGKRLYIDEIHKYKNWSVEIKNIYSIIRDNRIKNCFNSKRFKIIIAVNEINILSPRSFQTTIPCR